MTPARSSTTDETVRLMCEVLKDAKDAIAAKGGGLLEGIVIMKDTDISWETGLPWGDKEKGRIEAEWRRGAERGYELARNLGVEAKVVCPRTGEG